MAFELSASVCMLSVNACQSQVQNIPCTSTMHILYAHGGAGADHRCSGQQSQGQLCPILQKLKGTL